MTAGQKAGFLDPADEWFLLLVPYVGYAAMFAVWAAARMNHAWAIDMGLARLIVALIFLDSIHVIYSMILVAGLPELRAWARSGFWSQSAVIAGILGVAFYFMAVSQATKSVPFVMATFLLVEMLLPAQHIVAQLRGISFCYNAAIRQQRQLDAGERARADFVEKREKLLLRLLLLAHVAYWTPATLSEIHMHFPGDHLIRYAATAALCVLSAAVLWNGSRYPRHGESSKLLFLGRVLVYPLKTLTYSALVMSRAVHGTEYLIIFRRMVKNSTISDMRRSRIFGFALVASFLFGVGSILATPRLFKSFVSWEEPGSLLSTMLMIQLVTRYVHYHMDRVIYRMSDPKTRSVVGPLLMKAKGFEQPRLAEAPAALVA